MAPWRHGTCGCDVCTTLLEFALKNKKKSANLCCQNKREAFAGGQQKLGKKTKKTRKSGRHGHVVYMSLAVIGWLVELERRCTCEALVEGNKQYSVGTITG